MKKLILSFVISFGALLQAQNIEETTFTEKNKVMKAFGFNNPVCNQDVLVNSWKIFIKKHGGKVKGGIINKATGTNIQFAPSGKEWNGYFAYNYNEDNTMTIFTAFQDITGDFLTSNSSDEVQSAKEALTEFQFNIQKDCNLDDLTRAKNYSNSLNKEKIRNSDKIISLEKSIQTNQQKIDLNEGKVLSDKEQVNLDKLRQSVASNKTEIQALTDRNNIIDEELKAQELVIQRFQQRKDELEGNPAQTLNEESIESDNASAQEETPGKFFDQ